MVFLVIVFTFIVVGFRTYGLGLGLGDFGSSVGAVGAIGCDGDFFEDDDEFVGLAAFGPKCGADGAAGLWQFRGFVRCGCRR